MQCVRDDIELLVNKIQFGLIRHVAEKVLDSFQVRNGLSASCNHAVQALSLRHIDKAIADPHAADDLVADFVCEIKSNLNAILILLCATQDGCLTGFLVMPQHIERVRADKYNVIAIIRPDDLFRHYINASDKAVLSPIIEAHKVVAAHTTKAAPIHLINCERRLEREALFEVLEDCDLPIGVPCGVGTRVRPHKIHCLAKGLVSECLGGVDNVLSVAADGEQATIGVVSQVLWEDLC
mmetsp:Transcript_123865/g.225360  ORF Transcript_123865/g.225360 Transcript_123865/m.225360 type:complete len:238 (+) Transcript_123865:1144-1857(+)